MNVNELLSTVDCKQFVFLKQCSQFIENSEGEALIKMLPRSYQNVQRVKVRKSKTINPIVRIFNEAFGVTYDGFLQRAVLTHGSDATINETDTHELFYVFPVNGYKFMYNPEIKNSVEDHDALITTVVEAFNQTNGESVAADLLKFSYVSESLIGGIKSGAEIILFNIPFYYVTRVSFLPEYEQIVDIMEYCKST